MHISFLVHAAICFALIFLERSLVTEKMKISAKDEEELYSKNSSSGRTTNL